LKYKFKLSICMMVKDEEKNLRRCLDSLLPLLEKPYIELIIIDTGSTDGTVDIAGKYTKKVFHHPWNNNFSEMRNISISYASGEWIFTLDADEELTNAHELIQMIEANSLEKYNSVQLHMHDFTKRHDLTTYVSYNLYRLYRNANGFKFSGAVHNQPAIRPPIYYSKIILNHYGYQFDDKELLEKKFKRTAGILIQELEKQPGNIYYRYQLANSYYIHGDLKEALEEVRKGYEYLKQQPMQSRSNHAYLYGEYAREAYASQEFLECIQICEEGIQIVPEYVDLYFYLSISLQAINNGPKAIEVALEYMGLLDNYDDLNISKDPSIIMYTVDKSSKQTIYALLVRQYYNQEDWENSLRYLSHLNDTQQQITLSIDILIKLGWYKEIATRYRLISNEKSEIKEAFVSVLEAKKEDLSKTEKTELERALSVGEDDYAVLNKIRIAEGELGKLITQEYVRNTNFTEKGLYYAEAFKNMPRDHKEIFLAFKKIGSIKIKQFIKYLIDHYGAVEIFLIDFLLKANIRVTDYETLRVHTSIAQALLLTEIQSAKEENRELKESSHPLFDCYLQWSFNRLSLIYQVDKLRMYYRTLDNEEEQFLVLMYFAKDAADKENYKVAIKYIKEALEVYPYMAVLLSVYEEKLLRVGELFG